MGRDEGHLGHAKTRVECCLVRYSKTDNLCALTAPPRAGARAPGFILLCAAHISYSQKKGSSISARNSYKVEPATRDSCCTQIAWMCQHLDGSAVHAACDTHGDTQALPRAGLRASHACRKCAQLSPIAPRPWPGLHTRTHRLFARDSSSARLDQLLKKGKGDSIFLKWHALSCRWRDVRAPAMATDVTTWEPPRGGSCGLPPWCAPRFTNGGSFVGLLTTMGSGCAALVLRKLHWPAERSASSISRRRRVSRVWGMRLVGWIGELRSAAVCSCHTRLDHWREGMTSIAL